MNRQMAAVEAQLEEAVIKQYCQQLRLPSVAAQFHRLAEQATKQQQTHAQYLNQLLLTEVEDRERRVVEKRLREARLPRHKTLEEFDFSQSPQLSATQVHQLATGDYLARSEPIIFIGECGTGKTHLASGLCVAACRQKKRARFITAAGLVNELVEAQHHNQLGRVLQRWSRYDLIVIDEVGYVPLAEIGAELLFQVVSDRAEKAALIITTNLPFSEWTQVFTNARLCKALLDRITDRATIIETGSESFRFRRTLETKRKSPASATRS